MSNQRPLVSGFTCQHWRRLVQAGWRITEVVEEASWPRDTVQRHVHGRCRHSDNNRVNSLHLEADDVIKLRKIYKRTGSPLETSMAMSCHPNTVLYHTKDLRKYGRKKRNSSREFFTRRTVYKEE